MARSAGVIHIEVERCKGCGLCSVACPSHIIILDNKGLNQKGYQPAMVTDMGACTGCANCAMMCPDCAITVERFKRPGGRHEQNADERQ